MQYITLTLPCLDPGRQGPGREEHTGWAVAKGQGLRTSPSCAKKRESLQGLPLCLHFKIVRTSSNRKNLRSSRRHVQQGEIINSYFKNKYHFLWLFLNNVHICHRGYASQR